MSSEDWDKPFATILRIRRLKICVVAFCYGTRPYSDQSSESYATVAQQDLFNLPLSINMDQRAENLSEGSKSVPVTQDNAAGLAGLAIAVNPPHSRCSCIDFFKFGSALLEIGRFAGSTMGLGVLLDFRNFF